MDFIISVVIPVYQAEDYLKECVESVLAQTQQKIEIILVDDGSKDQSGLLCDQYAASNANVKVIHQENAGLTAAWKAGVREASGEYVGFVDSDDWIEPHMYQKMYARAVTTEADIVCCGIWHVFEDKDHEPWKDEMMFPREIYTKTEMNREVYPTFINNGSFMGRGLQPNRVSKLLKRELVLRNMGLCDDRVTVGEDYQFSLAMFLDADKIAVLKGYFPYYYRVNKKSMTGQYDKGYMDKIKLMKERLIAISDRKAIYDFSQQIKNDFLCLTILHIKGGIVSHRKSGYRICREEMRRVCMDKDVVLALIECRMQKLTTAEKLFVLFMKHHWYRAIYSSVCLYFR